MWSDRVKSPDINLTELLFIRLMCPITFEPLKIKAYVQPKVALNTLILI